MDKVQPALGTRLEYKQLRTNKQRNADTHLEVRISGSQVQLLQCIGDIIELIFDVVHS